MIEKDVDCAVFMGHRNKFVEFYGHIAQLKSLLRQGWVRRCGMDPHKVETVAEHIFSTTLMAAIVAKELRPDLDANHVALMLLIHDIAEALVDDYTPHDHITAHQKHIEEARGIEEIFSGFSSKDFFVGLWREYEEQKTHEALFAKDFDKLDAALMAHMYGANGLDEKYVKEFHVSARDHITTPEASEILEDL
jgi:putative hydrolases of HD superfamily